MVASDQGELGGHAGWTAGDVRLERQADVGLIDVAVADVVQAALDDVRANSDRTVVPECSYVRAWIEGHPDYQELTSR